MHQTLNHFLKKISKTQLKIYLGIFGLFLTLFFTNLSFADVEKENTLPLPNKENYDSIIRDNKILKVTESKGIDEGLIDVFNGDDKSIIQTLNIILGAVAILWLSILGLKFIFSQGEEEKLTKYKTQFGWIVLGLLLISIAEYAAFEIFDPSSASFLSTSQGSSVGAFAKTITSFLEILKILVGGLVLLAGVRSGFALITGGDQDDVVQKEKTFVKIFIFAIAIIILAETLIRSVIVVDQGTFNASILVREIVGLINFILGFLAAAATFMVVLSSLYYIASFGNDEMTSKAKTMITNSLIGLVLAYSSYSIVHYFILIL